MIFIKLVIIWVVIEVKLFENIIRFFILVLKILLILWVLNVLFVCIMILYFLINFMKWWYFLILELIYLLNL